ncbi:hypothetical protein CYMTET_40264 [Cymbomonas tetramitiformis]|uniref:EF-hand domain-containing protein n=1 Tax=Cymbomonas tetramitiformis TaxID=36881 RepID=A0AAE0CAH9_9CHLO|nr:hypothetical protein CYMTET_40264 [Cymbomonas tetramitiformis]|eukprot:gene19483-23293_t
MAGKSPPTSPVRGKKSSAPSAEPAQPVPPRLQKRNEKGGVQVHEDEINDAFNFLNRSGRDVVTREDLEQFMETFFPGMMTHKEVKSLIGPSGMSQEKLKRLLQNNDLQDFDPVAEAFKVLDPESTGTLDMDILKTLLKEMPGVGEIDREDLEYLTKYMDADGDGRVGLEDFAAIGRYGSEDKDKDIGGGSFLTQ